MHLMKEVSTLKKIDVAQLVGFGAMILGLASTMLSNWSNERTMERTIDEKIEERFAKIEEPKES